MSTFTPNKTIFAESRALHESWTPDRIVGRDDELEQIHHALQPIIDEQPPRNIFLYGKAGVGKTVSVRYKIDDLLEGADEYGIPVSAVWQNCEELNSSYQVAIALVNQLADPEDRLSETGHPKATVYRRLWEELDKLGGTVVIVLDEVDNIGSKDALLYQLPRATAEGNLEDTEVGLVGISNNLSFRRNLSDKVKSSLCEREIQFSAYDATELTAIMQDRAETAFKPGVLDDAVIRLCAGLTSKDGGDARAALDLLYEAGSIAKRRGVDVVAEEHVRAAEDELKRERIKEALSEFNEQEHMVLAAILSEELKEPRPHSLKEIHPTYKEFAAEVVERVNVSRRVHDHLKEMSMLGMIEQTEVFKGNEGNHYEYELDIDYSLVVESIHENGSPFDATTTGIPSRLESQLENAGLR